MIRFHTTRDSIIINKSWLIDALTAELNAREGVPKHKRAISDHLVQSIFSQINIDRAIEAAVDKYLAG